MTISISRLTVVPHGRTTHHHVFISQCSGSIDECLWLPQWCNEDPTLRLHSAWRIDVGVASQTRVKTKARIGALVRLSWIYWLKAFEFYLPQRILLNCWVADPFLLSACFLASRFIGISGYLAAYQRFYLPKTARSTQIFGAEEAGCCTLRTTSPLTRRCPTRKTAFPTPHWPKSRVLIPLQSPKKEKRRSIWFTRPCKQLKMRTTDI